MCRLWAIWCCEKAIHGSDFEGKTDPDPTLKLMRFHLLILFKIKVYINMDEKREFKRNNMTVLPPFISANTWVPAYLGKLLL